MSERPTNLDFPEEYTKVPLASPTVLRGRTGTIQLTDPPVVVRASTMASGTLRPGYQVEKKRRVSMSVLWGSLNTFIKPKRVVREPSVQESLNAIMRSWLNVMLVFIPISWALHFALPESMESRDTIIFVFSFLAIIPLAKLLAFATEDLSLRVGQTLAGLMNATLGNLVELIVGIIALTKCELRLVQSSLVGSILSNLLLVLGMCFFAGGLKYQEQGFGASASQLNSSLLIISVIAVLSPVAFHFSGGPQLTAATESVDILAVSRGSAILLLFTYIGYLLFQLWTHAQIYQDDSPDVAPSKKFDFSKRREEAKIEKESKKFAEQRDREQNVQTSDEEAGLSTEQRDSEQNVQTSEEEAGLSTEQRDNKQYVQTGDEEAGLSEPDEEEPQMRVWIAFLLLLGITGLVAWTAEVLVDSINGLTEHTAISKEFVGIILLPIVGNAAEHVTAVTVSVKDKLNLSLGVAAGSSLQIALFVIPFMVIIGWIMGKPMTLFFDPYESIVLFFSVLVVNYTVQDGKSNWMEGLGLMVIYVMFALAFWYYPGFDPSQLSSTCQ